MHAERAARLEQADERLPTAVAGEPTIVTLGCRLNAFESEVMRQHARAAGLSDCIVVNTCAVTGEAVRQAAQTIRKLRRERPEARIVVTGCAAQIDPGRFAAMDEVDHVIGNAEKLEVGTFQSSANPATERVLVDDIMAVRTTAPHLIQAFGTRARACIQVQNGCDHRCTFCIIPYGRGRSRSVAAGDVVAQVRTLVEAGYPEIVLTGVDLTSYGADLPGTPKLGRLVQQILKLVPDLRRLRLSSIDQVEADADLLRALADEPRLMPHLHLSMQSGDDMILKRMKRRHLREDAISFCAEVRRLRPDIVLGADFIAGFPTETEEMFAGTLDLVDECGLTWLHVFPYSPRTGTPAARMPQVEGRVIRERAARLRERGASRVAAYMQSLVGQTVDAVVERLGMGRTPHFAEIDLDRGVAGDLVRARVSGHDGKRLQGEVMA